MWRKRNNPEYQKPQYWGKPKPSTNPENPNALDKLAAMVAQAEARYREKREAAKCTP